MVRKTLLEISIPHRPSSGVAAFTVALYHAQSFFLRNALASVWNGGIYVIDVHFYIMYALFFDALRIIGYGRATTIALVIGLLYGVGWALEDLESADSEFRIDVKESLNMAFH